MSTWSMTATPTGTRFVRTRDSDEKMPPIPKWAADHPFIDRDKAISGKTYEEPICQALTRIWFFNGKLTAKDPRRHRDDDGDDDISE